MTLAGRLVTQKKRLRLVSPILVQMKVSSPDFYIPLDTPPEVLAYGSDLPQLEVERSGKIGALTLKLEDDSDRRKTIVRDLYTKGPLHAQRALYLEESLPSMAYMYIMSTSGGILQGDRYRMDIGRPRVHAHISRLKARLEFIEWSGTMPLRSLMLIWECNASYFEFIPDRINL